MSPLKALRSFARGRAGTILRNWTGIRPYPFNVPPYAHPVSDSFLWRRGGGWETRFHLMNALSLLEPDHACRDTITLVVHAASGKEIARETVTLGDFETKSVSISDLAGSAADFGFFAAFHFPENGTRPVAGGTCMVERNYVGYRQASDPADFFSYVHGNSYVFAMNRPSGVMKPLHRLNRGIVSYAPQLLFDDCRRFELAYVNPLPRPVELEVTAYGEDLSPVETRRETLAPHQSVLFEFEGERGIATVRGRSRIASWRPLIFKHYESHFDVFHG